MENGSSLEWPVGWMADAKELRNGRGQVHQVRVAYHATGFAVRQRWFGTYFLPFIYLKNILKKCMMRVRAPPPPLVVVEGHGDWCRCRFGLGKIPGSGVKKKAPRREL